MKLPYFPTTKNGETHEYANFQIEKTQTLFLYLHEFFGFLIIMGIYFSFYVIKTQI